MFGGLEIKGAASSTEPKGTADAPAASANSGFSFMNSSAPAPAAPTAPPSSAFSFLNSATAATETPAADKPAVSAGSSGFSFMQQPAETTDSEIPAVTNSGSGEQDGLSSFSFLNATAAPSATAAAMEPTSSIGGEAASASSSGFSFMASAPSDPVALPSPTEDAALSTPSWLAHGKSETETDTTQPPVASSPQPMIQQTSAGSATLGASLQPTGLTGAGVSFGGAMASTKVKKKKKSRAVKVGVGAGGAPAAPISLPAPAEAAAPKATSKPSAQSAPKTSTRNEALEAARRAEEFLNQKMKEQSSIEAEEREQHAKQTNADPYPEISAAASEDEVLKAAKAAAEEAKSIAKNQGSMNKGFMGGIFGRRPSPPTTASTVNNSSAPVVAKQSSMTAAAAATTTTTTSVKGPATTTSGPQSWTQQQQPSSDWKPTSTRTLSANSGETKMPKEPVGATVPKGAPELGSEPIKTASNYQAISIEVTPTEEPEAPAQVPQPPVVPPRTPTAKECFEEMMKTFREDVEKSIGMTSQLSRQRAMLLEERSKTLAKERLVTQKIAAAEAQQMTAAEAEEFELADQLGSVIDGHQHEKSEYTRLLDHIKKALEDLESTKTTVVDQVKECFKTIQVRLKEFEEEQQRKESRDDDHAMKRFTSATKHLAAEDERLQNDLKHLERDESLVAEERKEVETAISEQTGEFEVKRDDAQVKLTAAEKEIEDLRAKLKEKEKAAAILRGEVAGHDDSILKVRVKFARQLQRVQKKESTVEENRKEWESDKASFEQIRATHEEEVQAHSEALMKHEELMKSMKKEVDLADIFEDLVGKELGSSGSEPTSEEDGDSTSDLVQLQADVVKCEAAVSEAKEMLKVASATLIALEEESKMLIGKIPQLEEVKKSAAARRDFKAAGKASKEIKDATARLRDCQAELTDGAIDRKAAAETDLEKLEKELQEKQTLATAQEKESGVAAMKKLADRIKFLVDTKATVCGKDPPSNSMQGVGAYVLDEQITSLIAEGKSHGEKYGGWEELLAKISPDSPKAGTKEESAQETTPVSESEPPVDDTATSETVDENKEPQAVRFAKCRELTQKLKEVEEKLEKAVEDEDYDLAAELDESLQTLLAAVQALDLTDDEMTKALAGEEGEGASGDGNVTEADVTAPEEPQKPSETSDNGVSQGEPSEEEQAKPEEKVAVADTAAEEVAPLPESENDVRREEEKEEKVEDIADVNCTNPDTKSEFEGTEEPTEEVATVG